MNTHLKNMALGALALGIPLAAAAKLERNKTYYIKAGTIAVGMSKAAVSAAYGNPPSHRTPSLASDRWIYWKNRFANHAVTFGDGKVVATE